MNQQKEEEKGNPLAVENDFVLKFKIPLSPPFQKGD